MEVRVHGLEEPSSQPTQGFPTPTNPRLMRWPQLAPATPLADTRRSCFQTRKLKLREGTASVQRQDTHGNSLAVQCLGCGVFTAVAWPQSLVRELRS